MNGTDRAYSHAQVAQRVMRQAVTGALGTLDIRQAPFASLVTVATTPAGEPILLLSKLAVHTQNIGRDPRVSLLMVGPGGEGGDPLAGARVTLTGKAERDDNPAVRRRFLARHEEAAQYAGFGDFAFYRMVVEAGHLVAGFGRIVDLRRSEILLDDRAAADLVATEESAIEHMNNDHAEALSLYATRLLGMPEGEWRMTGVDPAGVDLRAGAMRARLDFPELVTGGEALRQVLADLADEARAVEPA
jgi:putative heme iron utilization protein